MAQGGRIHRRELFPLIFEVIEPGEFKDTLNSVADGEIEASDRLKVFLEREAGDQFQFLPTELVGPGSKSASGTYWVCHFLHVVDCLDEVSFNINEEGKRFVEVPVIDSRRVPAEVQACMVKHFEVVRIIRRELRLKLQKEGFTRLSFSRVRDIVEPGAVDFVKPDHTGSKKKKGRR